MQNIDPRIIEQFNARAPFKLEEGTLLVLSHVGSHSHGTYIPKDDPQAIDDIDYMGVVVPPLDYVFGIKTWDREVVNFQFEELDCVFYSFRKFVGLLMKNNPNVLGMLWMDPQFIHAKHPAWDQFVRHRNTFSSLLSYHSFIGYAHSQLDKMEAFDIHTQNEWDMAQAVLGVMGVTKEDVIANRSIPMPSVEQGRIIDDMTRSVGEWGETARRVKWKVFPGSPWVTDVATTRIAEASASIRRIHAKHFQGFMGDKRKNLVRKYGYDTKNAAHLIRLMRMCCEFLETGVLNVFRTTDAEEIKTIKQGGWTLEQVKQAANILFIRAREAKEKCTFPEEPNTTIVNYLVVSIHKWVYDLTAPATAASA